MKQKDLLLIAVITIISAVLSFVASNTIFGNSAKNDQTVEVIQPISSTMPSPDTNYFNNNSIDPTQLIQVGNNNNSNPFNGTSQ